MQTLTVMGRPVQFTVRQQLCMPPKVPVPKPGPCPGAKRGAKKIAEVVKKTVEKKPETTVEKKTTARKKAAPKTPKTPKAPKATGDRAGRTAGRDVREDIDYDKLESLFAPRRNQPGEDLRLKEIAKMQGFDGRPQLASRSDVDAMVRAGGLELFRGTQDSEDGIPGSEYARRFRDDDVYYASGLFGNGIYTADNRRAGLLYADGNPAGVNRMVVDPDARVIDLGDLEREMRDDAPPEMLRERENDQRKLMDLIRDASSEDEMEAAFEQFNRIGSRGRAKNLLTTDSSLYAMAKGYDVVKVTLSDGGPYYVILNRTAVTVEDPSSTGAGGINDTGDTGDTGAAPAKKVAAPRKTAVAKKTAAPKAAPAPPAAPPPPAPAPAPPAKKAAKTAAKTFGPPPTPEAKAAREHADNLIKAGRVPTHVRDDVREGLYAMADRSPQGMRALKGVGIGAGEPDESIDPRAMFQYMPRSRTIAISPRFNTKAGRDAYARDIADSMKDGYLTPSGLSPLAGAMVHEYGHHMAFRRYAPGQSGMSRDVAVPVLAAIARQIGVAPPKTRPQGPVLYEQEIKPWWTANKLKIAQLIGEYASGTIHEAIAEGWQEGSTLGTQARPWAREITRVLNR